MPEGELPLPNSPFSDDSGWTDIAEEVSLDIEIVALTTHPVLNFGFSSGPHHFSDLLVP